LNGCQNDGSWSLWVTVLTNCEWRTKPTTKQPRYTQCRSALANWDTSTDSRGGGGGGGAAAVEWGAVELEQGAGKVKEKRMWRVVEGIMGMKCFKKG